MTAARQIRSERGAVVVLVAFWLPVLALFVSFAVDFGHFFDYSRNLQNRADAAAIAAGDELGNICATNPTSATTAPELPIGQMAQLFSGPPGSSSDLPYPYNGTGSPLTAFPTFGGYQNDEQQVVQFCNQLRRLAVAIQGCVIITKHPSVAGRALGTGESGSVSWNNSVRSRMYLHRDKEDRTILKTMKNNYGRIGDTIPLRWERGCFVRDEPEAQSGSWGYRD